jgi:hypothetical protein
MIVRITCGTARPPVSVEEADDCTRLHVAGGMTEGTGRRVAAHVERGGV